MSANSGGNAREIQVLYSGRFSFADYVDVRRLYTLHVLNDGVRIVIDFGF